MSSTITPLIRRVTGASRNVVKRMGLKEAVLRFSYQKGIPPSLDEQMLHRIVREQTGDDPTHITYRRMSGWKRSGAYRLIIRTRTSAKISLVYKNALYSKDEIPALQGLPIQPGVGEFLFLKHATVDSASYLPGTYVANEVKPKEHYQYVMEDLSGRYRTFINEDDREHLFDSLPEIYLSFQSLLGDAEQARLPRMDRDYADRLLAYAQQSLDAYRQSHNEKAVDVLLQSWPDVANAYRRSADVAYGDQPLTLVHGDCNASNVLFHRKNRSIKLIDMEWAGWGFPHHDLVSLLKGSTTEQKTGYLRRFSERLGRNGLDNDQHIYYHCGLQRALLDAAFIAKQCLSTDDNGPQWFPGFVNNACEDAMQILRLLDDR